MKPSPFEEYIRSLTPTRILKRGNAFSIIEITEPEKIQECLETLTFKSFVYLGAFKEEDKFTVSAEWLIRDINKKKDFFELYADFMGTHDEKVDPADYKLVEYTLDLSAKEIYIQAKKEAAP